MQVRHINCWRIGILFWCWTIFHVWKITIWSFSNFKFRLLILLTRCWSIGIRKFMLELYYMKLIPLGFIYFFVQWMTAGRGIIQPWNARKKKNSKGLQLWVNLSSKDKMSELFFMLKGFLKVEVLKSMILSKVHSLG